MIAGPNYTPKSDLALSAASDLQPQDVEAAAYIERELGAIDATRRRGGLWRYRLDLLFDYVLRGEPQLTEADLRLLDGNR